MSTPHPNRPVNRWDALKCIALLLMFIDHAGAFIFTDQYWLRAIGQNAMPVFLFLIGYSLKYEFRLDLWLWGAILSAWAMFMTGQWQPLNILITIALCRMVLLAMSKRDLSRQLPLLWILPMLIIYLPTAVMTQFGSHALMFAILGMMVRRTEQFSRLKVAVYAVGAFIAYSLVTILGSAYGSLAFTILFTAVLAVSLWQLCRFSVLPLSGALAHKTPGNLIRFTGRHTLLIYALHYALLLWLYPASHMGTL